MPQPDKSNAPGVHHYIPIFYTKRWACGHPRMLTRFTRWPSGNFAVDRKAPKGVGWERDGYSFDGFTGDQAAAIELELMKPKDHRASQMLRRLEQRGSSGPWSSEERYDWTWFIVSLLVRGPEDVRSAKANISREWAIPNQRMEARYQDVIREFPGFAAPPSLRDYIASMDENYGYRLGMKIMADMTDHHAISSLIANMHWGVRAVDEGRQLLTSDRPVRLEFPLRSEKSFLTLPIGPRLLFLAAKSLRGLNRLLNSDLRVLVERNNRKVVRQARQFAFAADDSERNWVSKHLAKSRSPAFLTSFAAPAQRGARPEPQAAPDPDRRKSKHSMTSLLFGPVLPIVDARASPFGPGLSAKRKPGRSSPCGHPSLTCFCRWRPVGRKGSFAAHIISSLLILTSRPCSRRSSRLAKAALTI